MRAILKESEYIDSLTPGNYKETVSHNMKEVLFPFAIDDEGESVLDVLFDNHFESRSKDDPRVDAAHKSFCHTLLTIDPVLADEVMGASAVLCMESEQSTLIRAKRSA